MTKLKQKKVVILSIDCDEPELHELYMMLHDVLKDTTLWANYKLLLVNQEIKSFDLKELLGKLK